MKTPLKIKDPENNTEKEKKDTSDDDINSGFQDKKINPEEFLKYWNQMAENIKEESHSLYMAFTKNKPVLNNEHDIEININNSIQENEINHKKIKILGFLKEKLSNRSLTLSTKIITNQQAKQKAYLPEEKFKLLSDKNPNLKALKDLLSLDFY